MPCGQVGGIEVPDVASIGPLLLATNVHMYEPSPFDYATYLAKKLHKSFLNLRNNREPTFKFYSLLMHLILFYGRFWGMWPMSLKLNTVDRAGKEQPVQMWTSIGD